MSLAALLICLLVGCLTGSLITVRNWKMTDTLINPKPNGQRFPLGDPDGWAVTREGDIFQQIDDRGPIVTMSRLLAKSVAHALDEATTDHPTQLETLDEYEAAPAFTIIAPPGGAPLIKGTTGAWYFVSKANEFTSETIAHAEEGPTAVLRWGKDGAK